MNDVLLKFPGLKFGLEEPAEPNVEIVQRAGAENVSPTYQNVLATSVIRGAIRRECLRKVEAGVIKQIVTEDTILV